MRSYNKSVVLKINVIYIVNEQLFTHSMINIMFRQFGHIEHLNEGRLTK